jgi:hypothetical protein
MSESILNARAIADIVGLDVKKITDGIRVFISLSDECGIDLTDQYSIDSDGYFVISQPLALALGTNAYFLDDDQKQAILDLVDMSIVGDFLND